MAYESYFGNPTPVYDDPAPKKSSKKPSPKKPKKEEDKPKKSFLNKLAGGVKGFAKGAVASEQAAATGIARKLPGGDADIKAQDERTASASKNLKFIKKSVAPEKSKAIIKNLAEDATQGSKEATKTEKELPSKRQVAAGFAGTAFDILTAGVGTGGLKATKKAAEEGFKAAAKQTGKQSLKTAAVAAPAGGLSTAASEKDATADDVFKGAAIAGAAGAALPVAAEAVSKIGGKVVGKIKKAPDATEAPKVTISEAEHQQESANLSAHYDQELEGVKSQPSLTQKTAREKVEKDYQDAQNALDTAAGKEPTFVDKSAVEADKVAEKNVAEVKKIDDQVELIKAKKKDAGELSNVDQVKLKQLEARKTELGTDTTSPPLPRSQSVQGKINNNNRGAGQGSSTEIPKPPGVTKKPGATAGESAAPAKGAASSRVYQRLKADHPDLNDDVSYDAIKLKEDSEKAVNLLENDKQAAFDIAMGAKTSPDVTSTATNIAMFEKAMDEGDYKLASRLVKNRSLAQTRRGQELVAEKASISDNSTGRYVKELLGLKMEKLGKKYLAGIDLSKKATNGQRVTKVIDDEVRKLEGRIKAKKLDAKTALQLLDKMECL